MLELGVEGIKADDGEGYYFPPDVRFADGRTGAQAAWALRRALPALDAARARRGPPGRGRAVRRAAAGPGSRRPGMLWGGDQASDFWSLRALVAATLTAAASGFSNWSHDVGGYLGERLVERCPKELLMRWVQFGCFTPLMQAHGRFARRRGPTTRETLDALPRLRPAARAARALRARRGGDRGALRAADRPPAVPHRPRRPARLDDRRRLRLRPGAVGRARCSRTGRASARVYLPRGEWIDFWTRRARGRRAARSSVEAPLGRIPVWVRDGLDRRHLPRRGRRRGLGDGPERERAARGDAVGRAAAGSRGGSARRRHGDRAGSAASGRSARHRGRSRRRSAEAARLRLARRLRWRRVGFGLRLGVGRLGVGSRLGVGRHILAAPLARRAAASSAAA